jgi:hypothetical protein
MKLSVFEALAVVFVILGLAFAVIIWWAGRDARRCSGLGGELYGDQCIIQRGVEQTVVPMP